MKWMLARFEFFELIIQFEFFHTNWAMCFLFSRIRNFSPYFFLYFIDLCWFETFRYFAILGLQFKELLIGHIINVRVVWIFRHISLALLYSSLKHGFFIIFNRLNHHLSSCVCNEWSHHYLHHHFSILKPLLFLMLYFISKFFYKLIFIVNFWFFFIICLIKSLWLILFFVLWLTYNLS